MLLLLGAFFLKSQPAPTALACANFTGAAFVAINCYATRTWGPLVLEVAWALIATHDFWKTL